MAETVYPQIDPISFDLIVAGTGLPESILAAGASAAGKSVLHIDPNPFYGSHFSSLPLQTFLSFLESQRNISSPPPEHSPQSESAEDYLAVDLKVRPLYSNIEISVETPEPARSFSLDLSGPRVLFCADPTVEILLKSGASHHIEFKSIDGNFIYCDGKLMPVPISREGIFRDKSLGLIEKNKLMRFFKLVKEHFGSGGDDGVEERRISEEDLESPLVEYLEKQKLPKKIKSIILYAIAMADYDQERLDVCSKLIKTKDGIESLALYHSSVGRYPNAPGAFIYPIYGQGELPQAFCRCAAVKGALYVLRMPVTSLLIDKESWQYKGVRLASGQDLYSQHLVMDPSCIDPPAIVLPSSENGTQEPTKASNLSPKVARGIWVTRISIQPDISNLLVVFPPRSLYSAQVTSVRVLQLGSGAAVCPPGLFVLYLSTLCDDAIQGKNALQEAVDALFMLSFPKNSESNMSLVNEGVETETKSASLWSATYVQELTEGFSDTITSGPMPDGNLDYRNMLELTKDLFHRMYPQDEFFPETAASENTEESGGSLE